ncbi:hypothetical protein PIB30_093065, partial [Stylosanthes scabra]|nr:hypothetical protein [Stylosanthes scabra]
MNEMEEGIKRVSSMRKCSNVVKTKIVNNLNPICHAAGQKLTLKGKFLITRTQDQRKSSIPGKLISVQIYSGTEVDPSTGKGKLSEKALLKHDVTMKHDNGDTQTMIYKIRINVDSHFGTPRAFVIQNQYKKRFFLQSASIETCNNNNQQIIIHFDCNSWVYPIKKTKSDRLFFSNACYIPSQTPRALLELRNEELERLRGDGSGESEERKDWERIYEYDCYNDLSDPDKGPEYLRPRLGGSWLYQYPRRLRTGRYPSASGPANERRPSNFEIYVPSDERFSPNKMKELKSNCIHALAHFLSPKAAEPLLQQCSKSFESFEEILDLLFSTNRNQRIEGWVRDNLKKFLPIQNLEEIIRAIKNKPLELPIPEILSENAWVWKDDIEFGRQMLAGTHPIKIQCLKPHQHSCTLVTVIYTPVHTINPDGLIIGNPEYDRIKELEGYH